MMKSLHSKTTAAFMTALLLLGCTKKLVSPTTQMLPITSGQFGVVDRAMVTAIDFVRFENSRPLYSGSAALLAQEYLQSQNDGDVSSFLLEFYGSFTQALVDEIERELRARSCIYVVKPQSALIPQLITESSNYRSRRVDENIYDMITAEEAEYLDSLSEDMAEKEFDRLIEKYQPKQGNNQEPLQSFAVASQCLLNVTVGTKVTLVKFDNYVSISPVLTSSSYASNAGLPSSAGN